MCQCEAYTDGEECTDIVSSVTSGISRVCSGFENTLVAYPSTLTFTNDSVTIDGECVTVQGRFRSILYYHTDEVPPLSSVFWFDPITEDTLVARNVNGAVVGIIVSYGTAIMMETDTGATLTNVKARALKGF